MIPCLCSFSSIAFAVAIVFAVVTTVKHVPGTRAGISAIRVGCLRVARMVAIALGKSICRITAGFVKEQLTGPLIDGGNNSEDGRR